MLACRWVGLALHLTRYHILRLFGLCLFVMEIVCVYVCVCVCVCVRARMCERVCAQDSAEDVCGVLCACLTSCALPINKVGQAAAYWKRPVLRRRLVAKWLSDDCLSGLMSFHL